MQDIADTSGTIAIIEAVLCGLGSRLNVHIGKIVIWASPPCEQFSWANPNRTHDQKIDDFDMTLLNAAKEIIAHFSPDFWVIENVHGAIPIFGSLISDGGIGSRPTQQIGSVVLWGNIPQIAIEHRDSWTHRKMDAKGSRVLRPNYRAMIPLAISQGLLDALTKQRSLTFYGGDAEQDA